MDTAHLIANRERQKFSLTLFLADSGLHDFGDVLLQNGPESNFHTKLIFRAVVHQNEMRMVVVQRCSTGLSSVKVIDAVVGWEVTFLLKNKAAIRELISNQTFILCWKGLTTSQNLRFRK